jgi:hypothetical protein
MIERSEDSTLPDVVASGCSHGGEQRMEIPARSHDCARFEEQCEWVRQVMYKMAGQMGVVYTCRDEYADSFVESFRERFGSTADANLRAQRKHGEG